MTAQSFDHERLDVYRLPIDYVSRSFEESQLLEGLHRHDRDLWLHAVQLIPLNIAEGNGKRRRKDRARFLDIACSSALECAAIQDVVSVNPAWSMMLKSITITSTASLSTSTMKWTQS